MISLEQVQQLEIKVAKAVEYIQRVTSENTALISEREGLQKKLDTNQKRVDELVSEKDGLQTKLDANQKRIDELEVLVMRFKEDQGRIEDGIIAALDRLSQFEEAFENSLKENPPVREGYKKPDEKNREKSPEPEKQTASDSEMFFEIKEHEKEEDKDEDNEESSPEGELDIF